MNTPLFGGGGIGNRIGNAFEDIFSTVRGGTATAADYLQQGYENLFQQRAQGMIGGFGEAQSRMGAQAASQGLSPDVLQRLMFAPGQVLQANLGALSGESGAGLAFDLAKLMKGTSSEIAGLTEDELSLWVQKEMAKRAAKAGRNAGIMSGIGSLAGAAIGSFTGPGGAMMGSRLGGSLGGGQRSYGGYYGDEEDTGYGGSYGPF